MDSSTINSSIQWVVGPLLLLVVGWLLDMRSKKRIERVQYTLSNDHPKPFREDLDSKFSLLNSKMDHSVAIQKKQGRVLIAMRQDISDLFENDAQQVADVEELRKAIEQKPPKD